MGTPNRHSNHIQISINPDGSTSPTTAQVPWNRSSTTRTPNLGILGTQSPSVDRRTSSSIEAATPDLSSTSSPWSIRRWQNTVAKEVQQIKRDGWKKGLFGRGGSRGLSGGNRKGRRASGGGAEENSLVERLTNLLSLFYVAGPSHPHADDDLPPHSPTIGTGASSSTRRRPPALSPLGWIVVTLLFILGLRELIVLSRPSSSSRRNVKITGRNPFDVLTDYAPSLPKRSASTNALPGLDRFWKTGGNGRTTSEDKYLDELGGGDVTGVVLHWKRTDNVVVIVAGLCQYSFFQSIVVWNNNPDIHLTREHFTSAKCPSSKLRIYNSPSNMLFVGRYLACAHATTPYCFFQDDDWLIRPLRALYSQFSRDPEGPVVVHTSPDVATLYGLEWCFYQSPLHTCFSWVGTGAFTAKSHVLRFLSTITEIGYPRDEVGHADNSFTTFQNEPPYVLSSELAQLPQPFGHSDGAGIARNKAFIQKGLHHLTSYLSSPLSPTSTLLPTTPISIDTTPYHISSSPPLSPHPYTHHVRSPSHTDTFLFLTNIPLLPPPDALPYPGPDNVGLEEWENRVGWTARGWLEGGEVWANEETWAKDWSYANAVDGKTGTAFRSPDVIKVNDYIGVALLASVDAQWVPSLTFKFVLEDSDEVLPLLTYEVSGDGYRWFSPQSVSSPSCHSTISHSTRPDQSFPTSSLLSPLALSTLTHEQTLFGSSASPLARWYRRRKRRNVRLQECRVRLSTVLRSETGEGWRFVRARAEKGSGGEGIGWGVYEIGVESSGEKK